MSRTKESWDEAVGDAPWAKVLPPAPGDLKLVQVFVNTADLASDRDELASPGAFADFVARWRLPSAGEISSAERERVAGLREDLRALLRGNAGKAIPADAVTGLDRAASTALLQARFGGSGEVRLEPAADGVEALVGRLVEIVVMARLDGRWPRLKACAGDDCGLCFYDASRNRTRRFCCLRCSNRNKSREFRRRNPGYSYYRRGRLTPAGRSGSR